MKNTTLNQLIEDVNKHITENTTDKDSAIDHKKIQAGKIAQYFMDGIQTHNQVEYNIAERGKNKLAEVIYEYETRTCENCIHYLSFDGVCNLAGNMQRPFKGKPFGMQMHRNDGCRKFERVQL